MVSQHFSNDCPWPDPDVKTGKTKGKTKDNWTTPHISCFNPKNKHSKFTGLRGVTIYTETTCEYPILVAETLRFNPLLSTPLPGYVYKLHIQLEPGFNTIAWCTHSPLTYREGALTTKFPTLHMPGEDTHTQKTYRLRFDPSSLKYTHQRLPVNFPSSYMLGRPGPPPFLSTYFPTGQTPSLVSLAALADSESLATLRKMEYKSPRHFQFHNHLLWVQCQTIVNIQPRMY